MPELPFFFFLDEFDINEAALWTIDLISEAWQYVSHWISSLSLLQFIHSQVIK